MGLAAFGELPPALTSHNVVTATPGLWLRKVVGAFPVAMPDAVIHVAHRHCPCSRCRATVSTRTHVMHACMHLALSTGANQDRHLVLICKAPHSSACLPQPMQRARRMIPAAGLRKRDRPGTFAVQLKLGHLSRMMASFTGPEWGRDRP